MTIREKVSALIGQHIEENGWEATFKELDPHGGFDFKVIQQIVIDLCKRMEKMENDKTDTSV